MAVPLIRQCFRASRCFSQLFVQASDSFIVMLVVASHVQHRNARNRLSCPQDAHDATVDVAGEHNHVSGDVEWVRRRYLPVQVTENADTHFKGLNEWLVTTCQFVERRSSEASTQDGT